MIAVDTSVVVAAFASWHEAHDPAVAALSRRPRIAAHVLIESYSVLTRLPPPHRAPGRLVRDFLAERFPDPPLLLPARAHVTLVAACVSEGLSGGTVYDALVAATTKHAGATLLTRDMRARAVYDRLKAPYEFVG